MKHFVILMTVCLVWNNNSFASCNDKVFASTPTANFLFYQNGTVFDTVTGLMWERCPEGRTYNDNGTPTDFNDDICSGSTKTYVWKDALQVASSSSFAGYSDWRVPNVKELRSIIERACIFQTSTAGTDPAVNSIVFPGGSAITYTYWSSTPSNSYNTTTGTYPNTWVVSFYDGTVYQIPKTSTQFIAKVRLVRGGQ